MRNDGPLALTMHQPWASLVMHGIKRLEGREWPANHKGPLWIHAASAPLDMEHIRAVEDDLRHQYELEGAPPPVFPSRYPISALLGCANCVGVLHSSQLGALAQAGVLPALLPLENGST